ncbi:hypothetical protein BEWA_010940 [Theileria equi strain WA]|uniref:K Homology domain-containing protein n=1 Tax=Theileria equi strain WA TaxID=1537102 RepID=L0B373_THEEQ|nr:hypothetical protein BEWA_010940 [Theileria equi strain WA]AFZ81676.1 hypothetical protein BEWA_010940 [Theileria equi strain WA]|eukprot:XP_004831342.1 hypothetical protein BEWA_010940 [Theileria equi strain WA]
MMSTEDCKSEVYGAKAPVNPFRNDFVNELTGDMNSLKLSQRYSDRLLSQSFMNDKTHIALDCPEESGWLSGLAESCGSCNTTKTFMYDSLNTQLTHDKLDYAFDSNIPADIASDDLGFSNMTLPLLDYYPNYEGEKMNDLTPTDSHGTSPLSINKQMNPQNGMYKSTSTAYSSILSSENLSFDNSATKVTSNYRKTSYTTPVKESYVFLKILATQLVSGTIIGRGGKGLNWFRRKSKVDDIVLSMPWEVYPKTEYRTLLLKGTLKPVIKATCIIADLMNSRYSFMAEDNMMVMVVLPEVFLTAMEEIKRTTNQNVLTITLFRDDNVQHQEIVAVLKGNKSKIKDLVAAISTSISETIPPEKYCFVSYPPSDIHDSCSLLASDANNEALRRQAKWPLDSSITLGSCPKVIKQLRDNENDTLEDLFNGLESLTDHKGNIITNSTIASIINNKPEILSSNLDVHINLHENLPDSIIEVASVYNCVVTQTTGEGDKIIKCKITGPFTGCFATALIILNRTSESKEL